MTSALHTLAGPVALVALVALSSTARAEPARTKSKPAWPAGLPAAGPGGKCGAKKEERSAAKRR